MDETLILRLFDDERRRLNDTDITLSSTRYVFARARDARIVVRHCLLLFSRGGDRVYH